MAIITMDVNELATRFADAVSITERGDEVVITAAGQPPMRLISMSAGGLRILGMHPGAAVMAPDFDDPLPDEFWLGDPHTDPLQNPDAFGNKSQGEHL